MQHRTFRHLSAAVYLKYIKKQRLAELENEQSRAKQQKTTANNSLPLKVADHNSPSWD